MTAEGALAALHLDVLCEHAGSRLLRVRSDDVPTPRAHFLRTPTANQWLISAALPSALAAALDAVFAAEPVQPDPAAWEHSEPACLAQARVLLAGDEAGQPRPLREYRGPAFAFPSTLPDDRRAHLLPSPTGVRTVPALEWVGRSLPHEQPLAVAHDEAGAVVSVCHSARSHPRGAAAGVETAEAARRRGLAVAVTACWARAVRASGCEPLYSTWWGNEGSRAVASRLGLLAFGEDWHAD